MRDKSKHHRRSIRLRGYDYSQPGGYFITICTHDKFCELGKIAADEIHLNCFGQAVKKAWEDLPNHYNHVELDQFVIMPNHIHGIIVLSYDSPEIQVGAGFKPAPTKRQPLSEIIRGFKTFSARRVNELHGTTGQKFWQRNYYERIIRDHDELIETRKYIFNNPQQWEYDKNNPKAGSRNYDS